MCIVRSVRTKAYSILYYVVCVVCYMHGVHHYAYDEQAQINTIPAIFCFSVRACACVISKPDRVRHGARLPYSIFFSHPLFRSPFFSGPVDPGANKSSSLDTARSGVTVPCVPQYTMYSIANVFVFLADLFAHRAYGRAPLPLRNRGVSALAGLRPGKFLAGLVMVYI